MRTTSYLLDHVWPYVCWQLVTVWLAINDVVSKTRQALSAHHQRPETQPASKYVSKLTYQQLVVMTTHQQPPTSVPYNSDSNQLSLFSLSNHASACFSPLIVINVKVEQFKTPRHKPNHTRLKLHQLRPTTLMITVLHTNTQKFTKLQNIWQ